MTEEKIMRSQVATFLNTGIPATPVWSLLGVGIVDAAIQYNPQTSEEIFIHQDSGTTEIESYKPTMPVEATAYNGNAAFEKIDAIRKARAVGADAYAEIVNVWLYETPTAEAYPAEKQDVSIQLESFGGAGGEGAKINFSLNYRGDAVQGTFNPTTSTFTATP
jgi:hypothetical protein